MSLNYLDCNYALSNYAVVPILWIPVMSGARIFARTLFLKTFESVLPLRHFIPVQNNGQGIVSCILIARIVFVNDMWRKVIIKYLLQTPLWHIMNVFCIFRRRCLQLWSSCSLLRVFTEKKESLTEVLTSEDSCRIFSLRQDIRVAFSVASYIFR